MFRSASADERLGVLRAHPDLAGKLAAAKRLTPESTHEQASAALDALTDAERDTGPFTEPLAQACCIRRGQRGRRNRATAMRRIVHVEPQITSR